MHYTRHPRRGNGIPQACVKRRGACSLHAGFHSKIGVAAERIERGRREPWSAWVGRFDLASLPSITGATLWHSPPVRQSYGSKLSTKATLPLAIVPTFPAGIIEEDGVEGFPIFTSSFLSSPFLHKATLLQSSRVHNFHTLFHGTSDLVVRMFSRSLAVVAVALTLVTTNAQDLSQLPTCAVRFPLPPYSPSSPHPLAQSLISMLTPTSKRPPFPASPPPAANSPTSPASAETPNSSTLSHRRSKRPARQPTSKVRSSPTSLSLSLSLGPILPLVLFGFLEMRQGTGMVIADFRKQKPSHSRNPSAPASASHLLSPVPLPQSLRLQRPRGVRKPPLPLVTP